MGLLNLAIDLLLEEGVVRVHFDELFLVINMVAVFLGGFSDVVEAFS